MLLWHYNPPSQIIESSFLNLTPLEMYFIYNTIIIYNVENSTKLELLSKSKVHSITNDAILP